MDFQITNITELLFTDLKVFADLTLKKIVL